MKKIDLTFHFDQEKELSDDERKMRITTLLNGCQSEFWKLIDDVLIGNIKDIENVILDPDSKISAEEREKLIRWRFYQVELHNLPQILAHSLETVDAKLLERDKELDPYSDEPV